MNKLILIFALIAVASAVDIDIDVCTPSVGTGVFYLCPFSQVTAPLNATDNITGTESVTFSIVTEQVPTCDAPHTMIYGTYQDALISCQDIAPAGTVSYALINSSNANQGINITYPPVVSVDEKKNTTTTYNLIVQLGCNMDIEDAESTLFSLTAGLPDTNVTDNGTFITYNYVVYGDSKFGCPVISFDKIISFIADNKYVFAAVFGVIGLILTFFGLKLFKIAVFLIAALLGTIITGSLFFQLTHLGQAAWVLWAVFGVSVLLGVVLGVLAVKLEKVGFFCVGGALGVTGGLLLYNAVISPILKGNAGTTPLYITVVICALIGGIIAFYIFESILIIATSLIGSYFVVRVISIFAGHFPNEAYVAEGLKNFDAVTYAYLAGIVVLAILGMVFQFKSKSAIEKEQDGDSKGNYAYYRY